MQFYIIAPLLALVLARAPRGTLALLAAAIACSLWSAIAIKAYVLPCYIAFFVAGMSASHLAWRPSPRIAHASMALTAALALGDIVSPWRGILIGGAHPGPLHVYAPAFNVLLAAAIIPFAIATTRRPTDALDRMMGDLSYIVYLQHWLAMQWFFATTGPFLRRLAVAATSFALVLPVSWLIWRYYDEPINRLRARWVASRISQLPESRAAVAPGIQTLEQSH
jgi:peptidoglycan/LPS O-acetylase OafA/YrhL